MHNNRINKNYIYNNTTLLYCEHHSMFCLSNHCINNIQRFNLIKNKWQLFALIFGYLHFLHSLVKKNKYIKILENKFM